MTINQCNVSDTQVTVKACGSLVRKKKCVLSQVHDELTGDLHGIGRYRIYIKSTSESLLYSYDKQVLVLFLIFPHLSCYNYIMAGRLLLDEHKQEIKVFRI